MLCLVLMAVELVIVSTRVQSANYTAYKPSTGRPRARSSQTVRSADAVSPSRRREGSGPPRPHISPGATPDTAGARGPGRGSREVASEPPPSDSRSARGAARGPRRTCRAPLARPAGSAPAGTCRPRVRPPPQAQVTPGGARPAGPTWTTERPTPRPRPAVSPPPGALPLRFPSFPSLSPPLSSGRLPPPSAGPGQPQETSLQFWAPTLRAGSFDPVRPAAPSGQVTVAVADQPPSEPRGWRGRGGRVGAGWGRGGWGRGGCRLPGLGAGAGRDKAPDRDARILGSCFSSSIGRDEELLLSNPPPPRPQETPGPPPSFQNPSPSGKTACWSISWLAPGF